MAEFANKVIVDVPSQAERQSYYDFNEAKDKLMSPKERINSQNELKRKLNAFQEIKR